MPFRFESLDIWHMARAYATKIYTVTAKFPRHEDYGLRSQRCPEPCPELSKG